MKFGIEKCTKQTMRSGKKRHVTKGIELSNQEKNHTTQKRGNLQVFGNFGSEHHQQVEAKEKSKKRISQTNEKTMRKNSIAGISSKE